MTYIGALMLAVALFAAVGAYGLATANYPAMAVGMIGLACCALEATAGRLE